LSNDITYTPEEVAKILKISKFTVYEMIKRGDLCAYRIGRKFRVESADLESYIQKSKGGIPTLAPIDSSASSVPINHYFQQDQGLVICGQDIVLDILTRHLEKQFPHIRFLRHYIGSLDGLNALYRGVANAVTTHLWDSDTNEYNLPYVRRLLPGHRACVINLVYRMEGFYVAKGNPKQISSWADLARPDVRFINRERGSGARVLVDEQLRINNFSHQDIHGYNDEEMTHVAVASKVARGEADVGVGIEKAALQVSNVDFIPLQKERYDLVVRKEDLAKPHFQALWSILKSPAFQKEVSGIGGYDISRMGEIMGEV